MISFQKDQVILVTGASSGIGEATALMLNSLGATVIASGRNLDKLKHSRAHAANPDQFHIEPRDMLEEIDLLPDWVKTLKEKYGKLSGLVPVAGKGIPMPLREYDRAVSSRAFDLHYHAPVLLAKGFADRRNNTGKNASIVFISSAAGFFKSPGLVVYGAVKAAIAAVAGSLSQELAHIGIRVNTVLPAMVKTPLVGEYLSFIPRESRDAEVARYPLGLGEAEDVAALICFLLSDKAKWITGQNYFLDGGRYE